MRWISSYFPINRPPPLGNLSLWLPLVAVCLAIVVPHTSGNAAPIDPRHPIAEVMGLIEGKFAHPKRLRPRRLLQGAISRAAQDIPSFRADIDEENGNVHVEAGGRVATFPLPDTEDITSLGMLLERMAGFTAEALSAQPKNLNPNSREPSPAHLLLEGLLARLDPHAALLDAETYRRYRNRDHGRFGEVGVVLSRQNGQLTVEALAIGSPALRAGLRRGDRILQIDSTPSLFFEPEAAIPLLLGTEGSVLSLLVIRRGHPHPLEIKVRRVNILSTTVESHAFASPGSTFRGGSGRHDRRPSGRLAYLRVLAFRDSTEEELWEHLGRLRKGRTPLTGIILDLRGNPGGAVEQAIRMADLFLERGAIATLTGPGNNFHHVQARWDRGFPIQPLVVLMDRHTASAAELVVGALQANRRALVIGEPSYGKNAVQSVIPLSGGGALKLTVATFRTEAGPEAPPASSSGREGAQGEIAPFPQGLQGRGIIPHIRLRSVTRLGRDRPGVPWKGLLPSNRVGGISEGNSTVSKGLSVRTFSGSRFSATRNSEAKLPGFENWPELPYVTAPNFEDPYVATSSSESSSARTRLSRGGVPFRSTTALPLPKNASKRARQLASDYVIGLAKRILEENAPGDQAALFRQAPLFLNSERARLDRDLVRRLGKVRLGGSRRGIDWSLPKGFPASSPAAGAAIVERVALEVRSKADGPWHTRTGGVVPGETIRLTFVIRNNGPRPMRRLALRVRSHLLEMDEIDLPVGRLNSGQRTMARLERRLPERLPEGRERIHLALWDSSGATPHRAVVYLPLRRATPPRLRVWLAWPSADDRISGTRTFGGRSVGQDNSLRTLVLRFENMERTPLSSGTVWLTPTNRDIRLMAPLHVYPALAGKRSHSGALKFQVQGGRPGMTPPLRIHLMARVGDAPGLLWNAPLDVLIPTPGQGLHASKGSGLPHTTPSVGPTEQRRVGRRVLEAPTIQLPNPPRIDQQGRVVLGAIIRDTQSLLDVQLFFNGRKAAYFLAPTQPGVPFPIRFHDLALPGRNRVRMIARDSDGLTAVREFLLWRDALQGLPLAGTGRP